MVTNIIMLINSLDGGGAERVMTTLANEINRTVGDVKLTFVTLDETLDQYTLDRDIDRIRLDTSFSLFRGIKQFLSIVRKKNPDVILSFLSRSNLVAAIVGKLTNTRVIISERVNTTSHFLHRRGSNIYKVLIRIIYPWAACTVCVSAGVKRDLVENFGMAEGKLRVIYNPFDVDRINLMGEMEVDLPTQNNFALAVGRLTHNKNYEMLLESYAASSRHFDLVILGDGPDRGKIEDLAERLGLTGQVHLVGHVSNPYPYMARASLYVSSSLAEGFPNAMIEAMLLKNAVISTDCDSGPAEIIAEEPFLKVDRCTESQHGFLVPTEDRRALSDALDRLSDPELRDAYALKAGKRAAEFSLHRALSAYLDEIRGPKVRVS